MLKADAGRRRPLRGGVDRRACPLPPHLGRRSGGSSTSSTSREQPAGGSSDRPLLAARRRAGQPASRTAPTTPIPSRYEQVAQLFDSPAAPDLVRHPHRGPQLGGPGRPPRRARLDRRGPGPGAVHPRRRRRAQHGHRRRGLPARRRCAHHPRADRASTRPSAIGQNGRSRDGATWLARTASRSRRPHRRAAAATRPRRRLPVRRRQRQRALRPRRRGARRRTSPGSSTMGTAFGHGAMSSLPTVTLANHTSILTGAHPGPPRDPAQRLVGPGAAASRSSPTRRPRGRPRWTGLDPGVETHPPGRPAQRGPDAVAVSINEPCDARRRLLDLRPDAAGRDDRPPPPCRGAPARHRAVRAPGQGLPRGRRSSTTPAVDQSAGIWSGQLPRRRLAAAQVHLGATSPSPTPPSTRAGRTPRSRPRSVHDTDARARRGPRRGRARPACSTAPRSSSSPTTAWRRANPEVTGNWADALDDTGVDYRDEAYGFIYVNP